MTITYKGERKTLQPADMMIHKAQNRIREELEDRRKELLRLAKMGDGAWTEYQRTYGIITGLDKALTHICWVIAEERKNNVKRGNKHDAVAPTNGSEAQFRGDRGDV